MPLQCVRKIFARSKFPNAKLGQGYSMTEAGPVLAMCLPFTKEPFEIKSEVQSDDHTVLLGSSSLMLSSDRVYSNYEADQC
ncbi:hypothetical protein Tco_0606645 [Tanacetum coccineum]